MLMYSGKSSMYTEIESYSAAFSYPNTSITFLLFPIPKRPRVEDLGVEIEWYYD